MSDKRDLRRVLLTEPFAAPEQIRKRLPGLKMSDATIEVFRYHYICALIIVGEAKKLSSTLAQLLPRLKHWVRNFERRHARGFLEALPLAWGVVEHIGEGASVEELAEHLASDEPLTRDDRVVLADFIRLLPSSWPRGLRGVAKQGRSPETEAEHQLARRVLDKMMVSPGTTRKGLPRKNVPVAEQIKLIEDDIQSGDTPWHRAWQQDYSHRDMVVKNVLRLLKNKPRLYH